MAKRLGELDVGVEPALADKLLVQQGGVDKQVLFSLFPLPTNSIGGLITSNDTDTDHDIAIAAGVARSADDSTNMKLAAVLTKQIDAAWAVGDDQGGLDTGAVAGSTVYAIWLIKRSDTGVVDALFSASFSAPTMPANYDSKRLIAAVSTTAGGNIHGYTQAGDFFRYDNNHLEVNDSTMVAGTFETRVLLTAPPSSLVKVRGRYTAPNIAGTAMGFILKPNGASDVATLADFYIDSAADNTEDAILKTEVFCPSDSTIEYAVTGNVPGAGHLLAVSVYGFEMYTRREP